LHQNKIAKKGTDRLVSKWLPDAGGTNDQAAWLMAAFGILGSVEAAQQPEGERP
jgi:hypothetical protein